MPHNENQYADNGKYHTFKLKNNKGLLSFILFTVISLGIYPIIYFTSISHKINIISQRKTGNDIISFVLLFFIIGPLTLGIAYFVWFHILSEKIYTEMRLRGINYNFNKNTFCGWGVLGLIIAI